MNKTLVYLKIRERLNIIGSGDKKEETSAMRRFCKNRSYKKRGKNSRIKKALKKRHYNKKLEKVIKEMLKRKRN